MIVQYITGHLCPCSVQGHFGVISCTCDISEIQFPKNITSPTNRGQNLSNFSRIIFSRILTKLRLGFLKIELLTFFFSFSLTLDHMGVKISKRYSSYKSQPKVFKFVLNFPPNGPHQTTLRFLKFWVSDFFSSACAIAQQSYSRHAGVRRPSVDIAFSDTTELINAKFGGQVPIHHISRPFFFLSFFFFFVCFSKF